MNREQFLQKLRAEQTAWEAFLASIPTGQGEQAGFYGTWSVKDIVGHAAAWERYATGRLRAIRKITWQGCASCCRRSEERRVGKECA